MEETSREGDDRTTLEQRPPVVAPWVRTSVGVLIALTIALCGADRIDFLMGRGVVTLTPALPLYALTVIAALCLWVYLRPRLRLTRQLWWGILLVGALVALSLLSVVVAGSPGQGLRRVALLAFTIAGIAAAIALARWLGLVRAVRLGAWIGLSLALILTLIQIATWSPAAAGVPQWVGPIYGTAPTYGPVAPRPAGMSLDPNRGAFTAAVLLFLLGADPWSRYRGVARPVWIALVLSAAVAIPTLSRTGLVAWGIVVIVVLVTLTRAHGVRRVLVPVAIAAAALVAVAIVFVMVSHLDWMRLLRERLSISSGDSGGQHFELIRLGFEALNQHWTHWLTGVGFGTASDALGGFFDGRATGNFHSFYLTFLVETGVFGLLCALALTIVPLFRPGRRALAVAVIVFDVLYQAHLDGAFWLAIATLWLLPTDAGEPVESSAAGPDPEVETTADAHVEDEVSRAQ